MIQIQQQFTYCCKMFKDILKVIEKHKLMQKVNFTQQTVIKYGKQDDFSNGKPESFYSGTVTFDTDNVALQKLNQNIKSSFQSIKLRFKKKIEKGSRFSNYGEIKKVFGQGAATLSAFPGQVLLLVVWTTSSTSSFKPLAYSQQLLIKNGEKWGKSVRIVAVNIDDNIDDEDDNIKQMITSEQWMDIEHLMLGSWDNDHRLISEFEIQKIPYICLVDTNGIINFVGNQININLQERINNLLCAGPGGQSMCQDESQQVCLDTIERFEKLIKKQNFKTHFGDAKVFIFDGKSKKKYQQGKISHNLKIKITFNSTQEEYIHKLKDMLGNNKGVKFELNAIVDEQIPTGIDCIQCGKLFQNQFYYWCKWEANPQFRCKGCIKNKDANGNLSYIKNSILTPGKSFITSTKRLGKNILPSAPTYINQHNFLCNGCGGNAYPNSARYICIGCRPEPNHKGDYIDLCQNCIDKYIQGDQQIRQNLEPQGHNQDHPFLRVVHSSSSYYDF